MKRDLVTSSDLRDITKRLAALQPRPAAVQDAIWVIELFAIYLDSPDTDHASRTTLQDAPKISP